jgi:arylformamidase
MRTIIAQQHRTHPIDPSHNISMQIYDVSVPLSATTPTYPGDPKIEIKEWATLANGDAANVSVLHMGAHSGTHVDAPVHFIAGAPKVASLPLSALIGVAEVVEVPPEILVIDETFVSNNCNGSSERVLFKTRNSEFWARPQDGFRVDYTYINAAAAARLVWLGKKLVGIDYLSIEAFQSADFATHIELLSNGVVILEGLDLRAVPAGTYELICLPLNIAGGSGDGAPARAVLRSLK